MISVPAMIRTKIVELSVIPAIAYRQKLPSGGSGITIMRFDSKQPGIASISKTSGKSIPAANINKSLFPSEAFDEALELTYGLPYGKKGSVQFFGFSPEIKDVEDSPRDAATVDSKEYEAILKAYTDKKGQLSYELLNKDFIQFAK